MEALVALLALAGLPACVETAALPDPGPCAVTPEGVYEYGQIGIGTCLAGPIDLQWLDGGRTLAVANANPFLDFTSGSLLFLDMERLDASQPRHLVSELATSALELPDFAADIGYLPPGTASERALLAVTTRVSSEARNREAADDVVLVDVSDPDAPTLAAFGTDGGSTVKVGWDPVGIDVDAVSGLGWVVNRTSHSVTMLDLAADTVAVVPRGGNARIDADAFIDGDLSGSTMGFVTLETVASDLAGPSRWTLEWRAGTVRGWIPSGTGLVGVGGNADGSWVTGGPAEAIDFAEVEGLSGAVDPSVSNEAGPRLVFVDPEGTAVRSVASTGTVGSWVLGDAALLDARADAWDARLSGPALVVEDGVFYLFYGGESGGTGGIGLATSTDGTRFTRVGDGPVVSLEGVVVRGPTVLRDTETDVWRMWFDDGGGNLAEAESDDLLAWRVVDGSRFEPGDGGLAGPEVHRWGGRFQLTATVAQGTSWMAQSWSSVDGTDWEPEGEAFALGPRVDGEFPPTLGLAPNVEESFRLVDEGGDVYGVPLQPGATLEDPVAGWRVRVAVGQALEPTLAGWNSARIGGFMDGDAVVALADSAGGTAIGVAWTDGTDLTEIAETPLFTAEDVGAESVESPVVFEDPTTGDWTILYARTDDGVPRLARATSVDGVAWTHDEGAILADGDGWDAGAVVPGSVEVQDDGAVRLWYSGNDGSRWRIGVATSEDGGASFTRVEGIEDPWWLAAGAPGTWDDSGVRDPWAVTVDGVTHLWFAGSDGERWAIGHVARTSEVEGWQEAVDVYGEPRAVLTSSTGGFGAGGVERPVVVPAASGWTAWYAGIDAGQGRPGRARGADAERFHRELDLPTGLDTVGFSAVPARQEDAIALDVTVDGSTLSGWGCSAVARDADRGFLYVGCKLRPWVYVIDVRDDGLPGAPDLNYLDVEAILLLETTTNGIGSGTGVGSGVRGLLVDPVRGWLWGTSDEPEALYAIDTSGIVDDDGVDIVREPSLMMLPLPRSGGRDEGVRTQALVGPAALAMHPDGRHLLVSNFNNNSVSAFDLTLGPAGTLVAESRDLGENPYALSVSPDGRWLAVGNYVGEVDERTTSSTLSLLDADPASPTFLQVVTTVGNK